MSYTNSTPNLHLPQYIATDKPTYLGDWNASMQTIDTVITSTQATASGASSTAISANSTAQAAQQSANSANTKADANATNIATLTNNLSVTVIETSNSSDFSNAPAFLINTYNYSIQGFSTLIATKPSNITVVNEVSRIPLFSAVGNFFKQESTTITDNIKRKYIGFISVTGNDTNGNFIYDSSALYTYFDGANTVIYFEIGNTTLAKYNTMNAITINTFGFR